MGRGGTSKRGGKRQGKYTTSHSSYYEGGEPPAEGELSARDVRFQRGNKSSRGKRGEKRDQIDTTEKTVIPPAKKMKTAPKKLNDYGLLLKTLNPQYTQSSLRSKSNEEEEEEEEEDEEMDEEEEEMDEEAQEEEESEEEGDRLDELDKEREEEEMEEQRELERLKKEKEKAEEEDTVQLLDTNDHFSAMVIDRETSNEEMDEARSQLVSSLYKDDILGMVSIKGAKKVKKGVEARLEDIRMKPRLIKQWKSNRGVADAMTPLQARLLSHLDSYRDVYYSGYTPSLRREVRASWLLHVVNHVIKSRDQLLNNNATLNGMSEEERDRTLLKDQGFTRPSVLILCPFRNSALEIVREIIEITPEGDKKVIEGMEQLIEEYQEEEDRSQKWRPQDFQETFKGNTDDNFLCVDLTASVFSHDIIIASPLHLRMMIGSEGKDNNDDFLSSLQIVVVDQAEVINMQNWDHLIYVFQHLNLTPKTTKYTDFSRLKNYYINQGGKYSRQTIMLSEWMTPEMNSLWNRNTFSQMGMTKIRPIIAGGSIVTVATHVPQMFHKITSPSFLDAPEDRLRHFTEEVLPKLLNGSEQKILIFITSYMDFVRLRNHMNKEKIEFGRCSEYSSGKTAKISFDFFWNGDTQFLLYTERYHFYFRRKMKMMERLIFYGVPQVPHFYSELVNGMNSTGNVSVYYTQWEKLALERIVGEDRAERMIQGSKATHLFT
ncbi:digestive organ expansion factor [Planoprotostelium fungivorum]|uniref:Digestive organ expansion factor n=1 Tax=Planoprotostelium fungivorum TaxID=1890364 RepID=A0A2P6N9D6_9EUKA|nr:digestive organ expansion factor [Planoprotostelium fungivorum]